MTMTITKDYEKRVYEALIRKFGTEKQMLIAVEECSELQKELLKCLRGRNNYNNIAEEMADVEIMLSQMKIIFENDKNVELIKEMKIKRTEELYLKDKSKGETK